MIEKITNFFAVNKNNKVSKEQNKTILFTYKLLQNEARKGTAEIALFEILPYQILALNFKIINTVKENILAVATVIQPPSNTNINNNKDQ